MREMSALLRANIRSSKKGFISIVILLFIVSLSVTAVMTVRNNSAGRVREAMEADGFGDMWAAFVDNKVQEQGMQLDELKQRMEQCSVVDKVASGDIVWVDVWNVKGKKSGSSLMLNTDGGGGIHYEFFEDNGKRLTDKTPAIHKGETAVPIAFQSLYDCKIGDVVHLEVNGESCELEIRHFFEDPVMGSSMMGLKTLLISQEDMDNLLEKCEEVSPGTIAKGTVFHIFQSENSELTGMKLERTINKETNLTSYTQFKLTASETSEFMLILVNIFSGILMVFVVLLVFVALIIIGHSIGNSMELDYVNMGVLKAVGFTGRKLKAVYAFQYMSAVLLGILLGIPCAVPVIFFVNQLTKPATGLQVSAKLAFGTCVAALCGIFCVILLFSLWKLQKISHVTPVTAIRSGRREVYFTNRLSAGIHKKCLNGWLALRQITSNKKQYVSACIIAAILVFFLGMTSSMKVFMGSDEENMEKMFSAYDENLSVTYYNNTVQEEVEQLIDSYSPIVSSHCIFNKYLTIDGCQVYSLIVDDSKVLWKILKGRACKYDNEIVVTEFLAEQLGIEMGDTISVNFGDKKQDYLVTGYYQNSNDKGKNFAMTIEAYERLTGEETDRYRMSYTIRDAGKADDIRKELESRYADDVIRAGGANFGDMDSIVDAVDALAVLIYVIAAVFVLIAILLICGRLFLKEQKDFGIYKAVGFSTAGLRAQFAARFAFLSVIGGILGIILYVAAGNWCASAIFYFVGVSSFEADTGIWPMLVPFAFVAVLFLVFSWFAAGKIKKTTPRILIQE